MYKIVNKGLICGLEIYQKWRIFKKQIIIGSSFHCYFLPYTVSLQNLHGFSSNFIDKVSQKNISKSDNLRILSISMQKFCYNLLKINVVKSQYEK